MRGILIPEASVPMEVEDELDLKMQIYFSKKTTAKDPEVLKRQEEKRKRLKFLYDKAKAKEWANQNLAKK